jgi:hypothetical protein
MTIHDWWIFMTSRMILFFSYFVIKQVYYHLFWWILSSLYLCGTHIILWIFPQHWNWKKTHGFASSGLEISYFHLIEHLFHPTSFLRWIEVKWKHLEQLYSLLKRAAFGWKDMINSIGDIHTFITSNYHDNLTNILTLPIISTCAVLWRHKCVICYW